MSCDLSVRGFNTKAALKSHTRLYHTKATDEPAPILRRKKAMQLKEATLEKEDFEAAGNALAELDLERLPGHQKHVGSDWVAIFNPNVPRVLDVDLVHALEHQSVVCCVRFSHDGKYIATGSDRLAQVFDVVTGQKIAIFQDESVDFVGDMYIRSVCFSPNGKYLATGAEDKLIRVSNNIYLYVLLLTNTGLGHCF
jgi:WD40 repeat protein